METSLIEHESLNGRMKSLTVVDGETGELLDAGLILPPQVELAPTGLIFHDTVDIGQWLEMGRLFRAFTTGVQWWWGDWLVYGEGRGDWGEMYAQGLDESDYVYGALRNLAWVAGRIDLSCRHDKLTFTHHQEAAALESRDRDAVLAQAERFTWSVSKVRSVVRKIQRIHQLRDVAVEVVEQDSNLVHGDALTALAALPDDSVDLWLTDPPYGLSVDKKSGVREGKGTWDQFAYEDLHAFNRAWLEECIRTLKPEGSLLVTGTLHNIYSVGHILREMGLYIVRDIVWEKPFIQRQVNVNALAPAHELIIWARKGKRHTCNLDEIERDVWSIQPASEFGHPTEKPLALGTKIVKMASNPGDLVGDPFMGSGTFVEAAKRLKRRYWGCERDNLWFGVANERVRGISSA